MTSSNFVGCSTGAALDYVPVSLILKVERDVGLYIERWKREARGSRKSKKGADLKTALLRS
jgi:hypothetical protein